MKEVTWNDFPESVRKNLVAYYLNDTKLKQPRSNGSILQNIWLDYELLWFSLPNQRGRLSILAFTDEQWSMFLLRWA